MLVVATIVPGALLPNGLVLVEIALATGVPALLAASRLRSRTEFPIVAALIDVLASAGAFIAWVALNPLY